MSIKSVHDIISLSDSRGNPDKLAYKHLIKQLDVQIREHAQSHGSLTFQTPSIIWGKPMFDCKKVEKRIMKHYSGIGFDTSKDDNNDVVIRWKEEVNQEEESEEESSESSESEEKEEEEGSSSGSDSDEDQTKNIVIETIPLSARLNLVNAEMNTKR